MSLKFLGDGAAVQFNSVVVAAARHNNAHSLDGRLQAPVDW
jgi:hypothetical protein